MGKLSLCLITTSLLFTAAVAKNGGVNRNSTEKHPDNISEKTYGHEPDYNNLLNWAASPFKHDNSDSIPAFLKNEIRDTRADVFFIHPTSFFAKGDSAAWNADMNDTVVNHETDFRSILYQATVFNGSCRIFAPRYRQANMKAFYVFETPLAQTAFDLAYSDVRKAFLYFLKNFKLRKILS